MLQLATGLTDTAMDCQIQLLGPSIIATEPKLLSQIDRMRSRLGLELGWHYWLDLAWILANLSDMKRSVVVDPGAGTGLLQFMLAERGHAVISVDYAERRFGLPVRLAYHMETADRAGFSDSYLDHLRTRHTGGAASPRALANLARLGILKLRRTARAMLDQPQMMMERRRLNRDLPKIQVYQSRIERMPHLRDGSVDAVVSVSALEHLERSAARAAVNEFQRVLKPSGRVVVTTTAAQEEDWFHEPSRGWCLSERSVRDLFGLAADCPSNWGEYQRIIAEIRGSQQLRHRLSPAYRVSGANGMPWGRWDPQYVPVGVAFTTG